MKTVRKIYLFLGVLALLLVIPDVVKHFTWMLGGQSLPYILVGRWDIVLVNIMFFTGFILMAGFKRKVKWRSHGIYAAFIIALFAEMYGFPLTAYFMASYFGVTPVNYNPSYAIVIPFMGVDFHLTTVMIFGGTLTVLGLLLIIVGWSKIYKGKGKLVKDGVYKYSRHPQYVGILMVSLGWVIHWPTVITVLMWPLLAYSYYRLSRQEEAEALKEYPKEFKDYMKETPMFI